MEALLERVKSFPRKREGNYVEMLVNQSDNSLLRDNLIRSAVQEIADLRGKTALYVMVNVALPHSEIPWHRDFLVCQERLERWHLPLQTNADCFYFSEHDVKGIHFPLGKWSGPVEYWNLHRTVNWGDTERWHLIVDLK